MKFVRLAPKALLLVLATVFLAAASFAQDIAPTVRLTVTPGIPNPIYIKTQPNAVCALYTNGIHDRDNKADSREQFPENDAQHTLQLYADQVGTIHFNA